MSITVKALIKKTLQKSGVLTLNQEPSANEANDCLDAINQMIASWSNDSLMVYARVLESFPLLANVAQYTIGPGQTFNTVRPIDIVSAYVRQGGITDFEVAPIDDVLYATQVSNKQAPGLPQYLNFNNAYPAATISFFPVPATAYTIFLLSEKLIAQFLLNDTIDLPPGWERAIIYNGAIEISGDYGQQVPDSVTTIAAAALRSIKKAANKNHSMDTGPVQPRANNIWSGYNN